MAVTQEQIDKLEGILAGGARRKAFADHDITYMSPEELRKEIDRMKAELTRQNGQPRASSSARVYHSRGFR